MSWRDRRPLHQVCNAQVYNTGTSLSTGPRTYIIAALGKSATVDVVNDLTASISHRYHWRTSEAFANRPSQDGERRFEATSLGELWCACALAGTLGRLNGGGCREGGSWG